MKKFILLICFVVFLSSCSSTNHTYRDNFIQDKPVIASEVIVDVKVDLNKKVESTSSKRKTVELAKSEAYYKAISENSIDIVVDPIFETRTSDKFLFFGGKTIVKLKGFAGFYVNPRTKVEAIKELKLVETLDIHKYNNIYMGIPFPVNKIHVIGEKEKMVSSTVSLNTGIKAQPKAEKAKVLKSNFGFKITSIKNSFVINNDFGSNEATNNGFSLGFIYDSNPNGKFGFRTELMYAFDEKYSHINIPVLAKYSFTRNLSVVLGPSLTHIMNDDSNQLAFVSLGLDYGVSYDIGKKLFLDLRFSKGINDIGDYQEIKFKNTALGIGYRF